MILFEYMILIVILYQIESQLKLAFWWPLYFLPYGLNKCNRTFIICPYYCYDTYLSCWGIRLHCSQRQKYRKQNLK